MLIEFYLHLRLCFWQSLNGQKDLQERVFVVLMATIKGYQSMAEATTRAAGTLEHECVIVGQHLVMVFLMQFKH